MARLNVAIAGVGNVASALVQGVYYYRNRDEEFIPGVMRADLGGYKIRDIKFVGAFDVNANKVGRDLSEAIFVEKNNCLKVTDIPKTDVTVLKGPVLDGLGKYLKETVPVSENPDNVNVGDVLEEKKVDVLVNLVPVGADEATKHYAIEAIERGVAFINGMPSFVANDPFFVDKSEELGVPVIGDDVKSQVGATIVHRNLINLLVDRGTKIKNTYQLNVGGDMDFYNMLERERLTTKKITKTDAVKSLVPYDINTHIGPSDYIEFLNNTKIAFIRIEATKFCDIPLVIDLRLEVQDAFNSGGILVDAIRCAKLGLDRGIGGVLTSPSAYFMKKPPLQMPDSEAKKHLEEFISNERER